MAVVALLAGGTVGFFSAVFGLIALNISWLAALALWSGVGMAVALVVLALVLAPRQRDARHVEPEHA